MPQDLPRVILSRALLLGVAITTLVGLVIWIAPGSSASASTGVTFTVNSTGDGGDSYTGDGICRDGAGKCTLRAAIQQAQSSGGLNTIAFKIPGRGPHTIQPRSALPYITTPVIIDGYTQRWSKPNTNPPELGTNAVLKIELDGSLAGSPNVWGFLIVGGGSTVRGLVINRFDRSAF